ncbi:MAG: DUF2177 family protein [Candidatus Brocadiae bacterium]|nr:DUF2177 family protein [Candidatus Brocadiia bacterium]
MIDILWLGFVAKNFYRSQIGSLMKSEINWIAASIFYLLFVVGLVFFVVIPAIEKNSCLKAAVSGALFGLVCYATYDLTNFATMKDWPLILTIVDMVWGMVLAASVSVIAYLIAMKLAIN